MIEAEMMRIILEHVYKQFPKKCNNCQRVFSSYRDYLLHTERVGVPISYDLELDDLNPDHSSGNIALANCSCGNTIAISSSGMPLTQIWRILAWVKLESSRRGVSKEVIVCHIRDTVENMGRA